MFQMQYPLYMKKDVTYYSFLAYAILYFILNNVLLPVGLLYTTLLSPVFLYWLYKRHKFPKLFKWSILLLIPAIFQIIGGIDLKSYAISTTLVLSVWIFLFAASEGLKVMKPGLQDIFFKILIINATLLVIALLLLPFSSLRDLMWFSVPISKNIPAFPRLKMLAYEPSHYALLLSPVFLFYLIKILTGQAKHPLILFAGVGIPLFLSLSFGVLGALIISIIIATLIYWKKLPKITGSFFFYGLFALGLVIVAIVIFWPDNPVFVRLHNIFSGSDTSAKGRLVNSFIFASDMIRDKNTWIGVGPGQIKVLAHDLIVSHYKYTGKFSEVVRLPNSMAEMLAVYGLYGFILKIAFEIYFFIRLKIYNNLYSLTLFLFIFIYQFTGSFLTNAAEIGTWAIVFNARFERYEFNKIKDFSG